MTQFNNPAALAVPGARNPQGIRQSAGVAAPNLPGPTVTQRVTDLQPYMPVSEGQKLAADLGRVLGLGIQAAGATIQRDTTKIRVRNRIEYDQAYALAARNAIELETKLADPRNPEYQAIREALVSGEIEQVESLVEQPEDASEFFNKEYRQAFERSVRSLRRQVLNDVRNDIINSTVVGGRVSIGLAVEGLESGETGPWDIYTAVKNAKEASEELGVSPDQAALHSVVFGMEVAAEAGRVDVIDELVRMYPEYGDRRPSFSARASAAAKERARDGILDGVLGAYQQLDSVGLSLTGFLQDFNLKDPTTGASVSIEEAKRAVANDIVARNEAQGTPGNMFQELSQNNLRHPSAHDQWRRITSMPPALLDEMLSNFDPNDQATSRLISDAERLIAARNTGYVLMMSEGELDMAEHMASALQGDVGAEDVSPKRVAEAMREASSRTQYWRPDGKGLSPAPDPVKLDQTLESVRKEMAPFWIQVFADDVISLLPGTQFRSEDEQGYYNDDLVKSMLASEYGRVVHQFGDPEAALRAAHKYVIRNTLNIDNQPVDVSGIPVNLRAQLEVRLKAWQKENLKAARKDKNGDRRNVFWKYDRDGPDSTTYTARALDGDTGEPIVIDGKPLELNLDAETVGNELTPDQKKAAAEREEVLRQVMLGIHGNFNYRATERDRTDVTIGLPGLAALARD